MKKNISLILLLFFSLNGCTYHLNRDSLTYSSYNGIKESNPILLRCYGDIKPIKIEVGSVKNKISSQSFIGGKYRSFIWKTSTYYGDLFNKYEEVYSRVVTQELNKAGYIISNHADAVFLIEGNIVDGEYNRPVAYFGFEESEAGVTIEWIVSNKKEEKIIYKKKTSGYASIRGNKYSIILEAARKSLRNFLSEKELIESFE